MACMKSTEDAMNRLSSYFQDNIHADDLESKYKQDIKHMLDECGVLQIEPFSSFDWDQPYAAQRVLDMLSKQHQLCVDLNTNSDIFKSLNNPASSSAEIPPPPPPRDLPPTRRSRSQATPVETDITDVGNNDNNSDSILTLDNIGLETPVREYMREKKRDYQEQLLAININEEVGTNEDDVTYAEKLKREKTDRITELLSAQLECMFRGYTTGTIPHQENVTPKIREYKQTVKDTLATLDGRLHKSSVTGGNDEAMDLYIDTYGTNATPVTAEHDDDNVDNNNNNSETMGRKKKKKTKKLSWYHVGQLHHTVAHSGSRDGEPVMATQHHLPHTVLNNGSCDNSVQMIELMKIFDDSLYCMSKAKEDFVMYVPQTSPGGDVVYTQKQIKAGDMVHSYGDHKLRYDALHGDPYALYCELQEQRDECNENGDQKGLEDVEDRMCSIMDDINSMKADMKYNKHGNDAFKHEDEMREDFEDKIREKIEGGYYTPDDGESPFPVTERWIHDKVEDLMTEYALRTLCQHYVRCPHFYTLDMNARLPRNNAMRDAHARDPKDVKLPIAFGALQHHRKEYQKHNMDYIFGACLLPVDITSFYVYGMMAATSDILYVIHSGNKTERLQGAGSESRKLQTARKGKKKKRKNVNDGDDDDDDSDVEEIIKTVQNNYIAKKEAEGVICSCRAFTPLEKGEKVDNNSYARQHRKRCDCKLTWYDLVEKKHPKYDPDTLLCPECNHSIHMHYGANAYVGNESDVPQNNNKHARIVSMCYYLPGDWNGSVVSAASSQHGSAENAYIRMQHGVYVVILYIQIGPNQMQAYATVVDSELKIRFALYGLSRFFADNPSGICPNSAPSEFHSMANSAKNMGVDRCKTYTYTPISWRRPMRIFEFFSATNLHDQPTACYTEMVDIMTEKEPLLENFVIDYEHIDSSKIAGTLMMHVMMTELGNVKNYKLLAPTITQIKSNFTTITTIYTQFFSLYTKERNIATFTDKSGRILLKTPLDMRDNEDYEMDESSGDEDVNSEDLCDDKSSSSSSSDDEDEDADDGFQENQHGISNDDDDGLMDVDVTNVNVNVDDDTLPPLPTDEGDGNTQTGAIVLPGVSVTSNELTTHAYDMAKYQGAHAITAQKVMDFSQNPTTEIRARAKEEAKRVLDIQLGIHKKRKKLSMVPERVKDPKTRKYTTRTRKSAPANVKTRINGQKKTQADKNAPLFIPWYSWWECMTAFVIDTKRASKFAGTCPIIGHGRGRKRTTAQDNEQYIPTIEDDGPIKVMDFYQDAQLHVVVKFYVYLLQGYGELSGTVAKAFQRNATQQHIFGALQKDLTRTIRLQGMTDNLCGIFQELGRDVPITSDAYVDIALQFTKQMSALTGIPVSEYIHHQLDPLPSMNAPVKYLDGRDEILNLLRVDDASTATEPRKKLMTRIKLALSNRGSQLVVEHDYDDSYSNYGMELYEYLEDNLKNLPTKKDITLFVEKETTQDAYLKYMRTRNADNKKSIVRHVNGKNTLVTAICQFLSVEQRLAAESSASDAEKQTRLVLAKEVLDQINKVDKDLYEQIATKSGKTAHVFTHNTRGRDHDFRVLNSQGFDTTEKEKNPSPKKNSRKRTSQTKATQNLIKRVKGRTRREMNPTKDASSSSSPASKQPRKRQQQQQKKQSKGKSKKSRWTPETTSRVLSFSDNDDDGDDENVDKPKKRSKKKTKEVDKQNFVRRSTRARSQVNYEILQLSDGDD